jgi:hypothetical protein
MKKKSKTVSQYDQSAEWDGEKYMVRAGWQSYDGDNWTDDEGNPVTSDDFELSTILLLGGPRNGERVS